MERPFGAEIELAGMTRQRALHVLRLVGFDIRDEGYNHDTRTWWKIVPDASVTNGFEVVSPILHGTEGVEALKDVVTALDDAGGSVNRVCGLHIHVDGRNLEVRHIRSIVQRYARFEDEIDAFMPPSRRGNQNQYCRTMRDIAANEYFLRADTVASLVAAQGGRYYKVNLQPLRSQGSLEFRQHSGTLNSAKIHNWLGFLDGFVRESCRRADIDISETVAPTSPQPETPMPRLQPRLAAIVNLLTEHPEGLSSDFLQGALNLQRHSLRASLTFIRRAGIGIESQRQNGQTFYRLTSLLPQTGQVRDSNGDTLFDGDTLFAGIAPDIAHFYRNRALVLNAERG